MKKYSQSCFVCAVFGVVLLMPAGAHSADDEFKFDAQRYAAGVTELDVDHVTRMTGWRLSDRVYFGRRSGDVDDFGFVLHDGDTQWSFTQDGIGWRRAVTLFPKGRINP